MAAKVAFRGGYTCSCVATSLPWVELDMIRHGIISNSIDIFQLGWRGDVSASAGTHDQGGCTDVGQWNAAAIDIWRLWGWTMQRRDLTGIKTHGHGWPWGCDHLAPAADAQARDWANRRNGLASHGPVVGRWPVPTWDDAIRERKGALLKDIADAVADELVRRRADLAAPKTNAEAVLNARIGSGKDMDEWTLAHLVDWTARSTGDQGDVLADIQRKIAALPAAVDARLDDEQAATKAQIDALTLKIDAIAAAVGGQPPAARAAGAPEDADPSHDYLKQDQ